MNLFDLIRGQDKRATPDAPVPARKPALVAAPATQTINAAGLQLIKDAEGLRLDAYLCPANVWTIGYGTTGGIRKGMRVTKDEAEKLLRMDVTKFERAVARLVNVSLTSNQFSALVSFVYNVGEGAFASSTMLRLLNKGEFGAAADQFARWNKAGGRALIGLTKRRAAERALFLKP